MCQIHLHKAIWGSHHDSLAEPKGRGSKGQLSRRDQGTGRKDEAAGENLPGDRPGERDTKEYASTANGGTMRCPEINFGTPQSTDTGPRSLSWQICKGTPKRNASIPLTIIIMRPYFKKLTHLT